MTSGQLEENFKNGEPIVISHTGLNTRLGNNEKMAQMFYPRLISESLAKGEKMNFPKQDLNAKNHVWNGEDENFYCSTIRELAKLGYSKDEIEKITGGNFARVFKKATE